MKECEPFTATSSLDMSTMSSSWEQNHSDSDPHCSSGNNPSVPKVGNTHSYLVPPLTAVFPDACVWPLDYLSKSQDLPQVSIQVSFPSHTTHYMSYIDIPIGLCPVSSYPFRSHLLFFQGIRVPLPTCLTPHDLPDPG